MEPNGQRATTVPRSWRDALAGTAAAALLDGVDIVEARALAAATEVGSIAAIVADGLLQRSADYRSVIRSWFDPLRIGGRLVIIVPHALLHDRLLALPARWDRRQRRLYTPASLLAEIEEALPPNHYRIRFLADLDAGYDYAAPLDRPPNVGSDLAVVVERIAPPDWRPALIAEDGEMTAVVTDTPDYAFEPSRTRIEIETVAAPRRILLLKLDHLGDLVMGVPALRRARACFPDAEITLAVGSWNADMARGLGVADHVVVFDAFPRNSSEEEVDVAGKAALFQAAVPGRYDLAIDLRTDPDTRLLLRHADAGLRAGIGTRAHFPFLDIFLPIDSSRHEPETARELRFTHRDFHCVPEATRTTHRITIPNGAAPRYHALVWGPYLTLREGRYIFEPAFDLDDTEPGLLEFDVAIDAQRITARCVDGRAQPRLSFTLDRPNTSLEFRVWPVQGQPALGISFYGGRLIREGAASVLHQSEYGLLLVDLIRLRLERTGLLADIGASS